MPFRVVGVHPIIFTPLFTLIEFLELLIKDAGKKVFLSLDNLRVHHSKPVKAWLEENKEKIECFYLPSYSPELNPEDRLNSDLKQAIGSKVPVRTKEMVWMPSSPLAGEPG